MTIKNWSSENKNWFSMISWWAPLCWPIWWKKAQTVQRIKLKNQFFSRNWEYKDLEIMQTLFFDKIFYERNFHRKCQNYSTNKTIFSSINICHLIHSFENHSATFGHKKVFRDCNYEIRYFLSPVSTSNKWSYASLFQTRRIFFK